MTAFFLLADLWFLQSQKTVSIDELLRKVRDDCSFPYGKAMLLSILSTNGTINSTQLNRYLHMIFPCVRRYCSLGEILADIDRET